MPLWPDPYVKLRSATSRRMRLLCLPGLLHGGSAAHAQIHLFGLTESRADQLPHSQRDIGNVAISISSCLFKSHVAQVLVTGHSLGGALAMLAAHDIAKALEALDRNTSVACYTFGAPRVGNYAFASEYGAAVPDSWSIINDQVG